MHWLDRGAQTAQRNRRHMARTGTTLSGQKLWTPAEETLLRELYPLMTYAEMADHFKGRTWMAIRHKAQKLGLTKQRHVWTAAEISKLRRVYSSGTLNELRSAFPDVGPSHLASIARYHGARRPRTPFKETGVPAIDQIRRRAFELGYSMVDVDQLARSKKYFANGGWHSGHLHHRAIARAIDALDGDVGANWRSSH